MFGNIGRVRNNEIELMRGLKGVKIGMHNSNPIQLFFGEVFGCVLTAKENRFRA
jgi:hypothetical protein